MYSHDADALSKPDIHLAATPEVAREDVNGARILGSQDGCDSVTGRLDAPRSIGIAPRTTYLKRETEIRREAACAYRLSVVWADFVPLGIPSAADVVDPISMNQVPGAITP